MLLLSGWVLFTSRDDVASAATANGQLELSPTSGDSATDFTLTFPNGAVSKCPGDTANDGYYLQGFVVPGATVVDDLTFDGSSPSVGQPLFEPSGTAVQNYTVEPSTGNILQLPGTYTFTINSPGDFQTGTYLVGLACTKGDGAGMVKTYWTTAMDITTDASAGPAQFTWVSSTTPPPSSTTSTSVDPSSTTTSSVDPSSTTTSSVDASTTTTTSDVSGGGTSNTGSGGGSSNGSPSSASPVSTVGQLPFTGSSPLPMVFWAVSLLVFGRFAMLLGKRPKVVGDGAA